MSNSFYRSETMAYCELFLQSEMAYACIGSLGEESITQFTDINAEMSAYQRKFVRELRECDETERQLRALEVELKKENIRVKMDVENPPAPTPKELVAIRKRISHAEKQLLFIKNSSLSMRSKKYELDLIRNVLNLTDNYFVESSSRGWENVAQSQEADMIPAPSSNDLPPTSQLHYICGVVLRERSAAFERMLWRFSRGNVFFRSMTIDEELDEDPVSAKKEQLNVFLVLFQGDALKQAMLKVCTAFHTTNFNCPENMEERVKLRTDVMTRIEDMKTVLNEARDQRDQLLAGVASEHRVWVIQVRKAKSIYHILNMLNPDVTNKYLIGEFWCPERDLPSVENALQAACDKAPGNAVGVPYIVHRMDTMPKKVPTYFRLNKLTRAYHNIVSAYGVAAYQEVNPALYTVITFPFLFSIMFGDLGHGIIVLLFALWLVIKEKSLQKVADRQESFKMIFGGRYVILLMGIFSIYAGLIYNDIFSKAINIFQTQWHTDFHTDELLKEEMVPLSPVNHTHSPQWPYPIGMDPLWLLAENRIVYINAAKMKFSVIIGVVQMFFGLVLSLMNHIHFKNYINIFCEFIPQVLFITCIFVYMDALIFFKWIYFNADRGYEAPSILIGMINMVLFKYSDDTPPDRWISNHLMYLQYALVVLAVISVPWMLLIKPFYLKNQAKVKAQKKLIEEASRRTSNSLAATANQPQQPATTAASGEGVSATPGNPPGFSSVFNSMEMRGRLQSQQSVVSSINLPIRSRSNTVASKARKSVAASSVMSGVDASSASSGSSDDGDESNASHEEEEKFDFAEVFIHQTIHTIEYVLGLISHTASYLRLWALSLAHAELSEVLWQMVLRRGFNMASSGTGGFIAILIIFVFWAVLTLAILCLMEGLSAFLHALRLQWVEFQSKFYAGDGVLFKPFNFKLAFRLKFD